MSSNIINNRINFASDCKKSDALSGFFGCSVEVISGFSAIGHASRAA
jgi:hypothetical protein